MDEGSCECTADLPCVGDAVGLLVVVPLEDGAGEVVGPADGAGVPAVVPTRDDGWPGPAPPDADEPALPGVDLPPPSGWLPCPGAEDAGGCGAAHCVNGAFGPPDMATMTAARQAAITAMVPNPANRKTWWRRPDGSANTDLDSTRGF